MRSVFKYTLLLAGILIGTYHLWLSFKAWFVFRNNEPVSLWIFMFSGPLSTLPASITAFYEPKIGSSWLICGSIISFIFAMVAAGDERDLDTAVWFLTTYSAPLFVLGLGVFLVAREKKPGALEV